MTNFKDVIAVRDEFNQGLHFESAEKENTAYLNSISGKLNALKETWISILNTFAKSESIKNVLDVLIKVSETIDSVVKSLDSSGSLLTATMGALFGGGDLLKNFAGYGNNNKVFNFEKVGEGFQLIQTEGTKTSSIFKDVWESMNEGTSLTNSLGKGVKSLGKGLASTLIPNLKSMALAGVKGIALGLAFKGIGWVMDNVINKYDTMEEKIAENITAMESEIESLNSQKKTISEIAEEYDKLNTKKDKTEEEVQRFSELKSQIATAMPELVGGYDENGDPILMLKGSAQDLVAELEKAVAEKKELIKLEQTQDSKVASEQIVKTKKELEKAKKDLEDTFKGDAFSSTGGVINNILSGNSDINALKSRLDKQAEEYNKHYEKLKQYAQEYRDDELRVQQSALNHLFETDLYTGINDEKLKQTINSWTSLFDWGEFTNNAQRIEMVENLSEVLASGKIDVDKWKESWDKANESFKLTGNEEEYIKNLRGLANELESLTGISASEWIKGLTQEFDGLSYADEKLNKFLESLGSSRIELANGDNIAVQLKKQFDDLNNFLEYGLGQEDLEAVYNLYVKINEGQIYENLPSQIKEIIDKALGDDKITEEEHAVIMSLTSAISNEGAFSNNVADKINKLLTGSLSEEELNVPLKINDSLTLSKDTLQNLHSYFIDNPLEVDLKINPLSTHGLDETKQKVADLSSEIAKYRETKDIKASFEISGEEKGKLVAEIIKKLQASPEITNKLILDLEGQGQLDKLKSYDDLLEWLKQNPTIATEYGITVKGAEETKKKVEEVNKEVSKVKEVEDVSVDIESNASVTASELKDLIEFSAEVKDGVYKITFTAEVDTAKTNIDNLCTSVKTLTDNFSNSHTVTFNAETSQPAKNISGLIKRVEQIKALNGKTFKYYADTEQSAKNISGLIKRVEEIYGLKGKTFYYYAVTSSASTNISNLINKIDTLNGKKGKSFSYSVNTNYTTTGSSTVNTTIPNKPRINTLSADTVSLVSPISAIADNIANQTSSIQANLRTGVGEISSFSSSMARATSNTPLAINTVNINNSVKYSVNLLQELENRISKVNNELSILDERMESAVGTNKIKYLKQQNDLYKEQISLQREYQSNLRKEQDGYKSFLQGKGFNFNSDGNLTNYEEKLLAMEKELNRLEELSQKANDSYSNYTGDNENKKNSLKSAYETARKRAESYSDNLSEIKKYLDAYLDVTFTDIPKANQEWQSLQNSIAENNREIEKLNRESKLYKFNNAIKETESYIESLSNRLDILSIKMELNESDTSVLNEYISLLEQQKNLQKSLVESYEESAKVYRDDLSKYGFNFDIYGQVSNLDNVLNNYQNTSELEYLTEVLEEYLDIQNTKLPNAEKEWLNLEKAIVDANESIKDSLKEQLNDTKDIEDKITDIYKKQVEERIEAINKETDAKIKSLKKQQDAYNKYREEVNYEKEYDEKLAEILEIQRQLDIATRDTSFNGQKKVQELQKELVTAQKELQELTQDKLDENINDMFDNETNRLEEENEKLVEDLENTWTDSKIAEMVAQALNSGVFTDIEGNVQSLESALINFASETGELFGVLGAVIKDELITNLELARNTVMELSNIMKGLDITGVQSASVVYSATDSLSKSRSYGTSSGNQVNITSPIINIEGNVDSDVVQELKDISNKIKDDVINAIASSIR